VALGSQEEQPGEPREEELGRTALAAEQAINMGRGGVAKQLAQLKLADL
jgi:hypothetical protein